MARSISSWVGIEKKVKTTPTLDKTGRGEEDQEFQEYLGTY